MFSLFRIIMTGLFAYFCSQNYDAFLTAESLEDDVGNAGLLAQITIFGVFIGILWAPIIGAMVAAPMTNMMTAGSAVKPSGFFLRKIVRAQNQGDHDTALFWIFLEIYRNSKAPKVYLLGLDSAEPGGKLQRWFAQKTYSFSNAQNCTKAYRILTEQHGETPPIHKNQEVVLAIHDLERQAHQQSDAPPEPEKLRVPVADIQITPKLVRKKTIHNIKLFDGDMPPEEEEKKKSD